MKTGFTIQGSNGQYLKSLFGIPTSSLTQYFGMAVKFRTETEAAKIIEGRETEYKVVPFKTVKGVVRVG